LSRDLATHGVLRGDRFRDKTAVVTGGSGGLGRAVAEGFASDQGRVAVLDVDAAAVESVVEGLRRRYGQDAAAGFTIDVADSGAVVKAMRAIHADLGGPDVLVTCAGGSLGTPRDLPDISAEDLDLVLAVNLKGTFHCCQAAVPYMAEVGGGAIVTVSSIGGRATSPVTGVPYAAAKAGVIGLTRRLAREVGPQGIRVNAVAPGLFLSGPRLEGMWAGLSGAERAEVLEAIPLRRLPEIEEAVDPILFLASDEASYITGAVLDINGGRFMG
jgi:3-oxoacyl-[acyl-carrier protein] reductase